MQAGEIRSGMLLREGGSLKMIAIEVGCGTEAALSRAFKLQRWHDTTRVAAGASVRVVLDTNVVLDWLVFCDASVAELRRALADGTVQIITHEPAVDELRRVLAYPQCKLQPPVQQEMLRRYQSQTSAAALPEGFAVANLPLPKGFPRCRDRDDEHFIALAHHARADALVTKDKEILQLRKRAAKFDVTILSPTQLAGALQAIAPSSNPEPEISWRSRCFDH